MRQHLSGIVIFLMLFGLSSYSFQVTEARPSITPGPLIPISSTDSAGDYLSQSRQCHPLATADCLATPRADRLHSLRDEYLYQ